MAVDGILNLNKPIGMTSHDMVGFVRRLSGQRRVGHAGTLDPMAEGVLVVALGKATRIIEYIMESRKLYCAEIVLGVTTTTYDAEGEVVKRVPHIQVSRHEIEQALSSLTGQIWQVPPMYSAIKRHGQRLYELARHGIEVEREPRLVNIYSIQLLDWRSPMMKVMLEVSKGTYIRSFAHDLGELLGTGAYLSCLVRVASGRFTIEEALSPADLTLAVEFGYWKELLYPPDEGMLDYEAVILNEALASGVHEGQSWPTRLSIHERQGHGPTRAYSPDGEMIAVVQLDSQTGRWQPKKVLV